MVYFILQTANGEKIGDRTYMEHSGARRVAVRLAGKYRNDASKRGSAIKIVREGDGLYDTKVVEYINID